MIITKKALPRRTVLKGAGAAAIGLPFLNAMMPALSATAAQSKPKRLVILAGANGNYIPHFFPKGEGGTDYVMSPILLPLEPVRNRMVIMRGFGNAASDQVDAGAGIHARTNSAFLSGCRPKRTEGADVELGKTIDQYVADLTEPETPLRSLELQLESSFAGSNCDGGYACAYTNTFSWRTPTQPNPMEDNPRIIFEQLFGDGGSAEQQRRQHARDRSLLDWVDEEMKRLQRQLGADDRRTLGEFFDSVRDVEARIQRMETHLVTVPEAVRPSATPENSDEYAQLMFDLLFLGLQSDVTRVVSFQLSREQSGKTYPYLGVNMSHHTVSHHAENPEKAAAYVKIGTYYADHASKFVQRLAKTPEDGTSMLDQSLVWFGSSMGDGNTHAGYDLPTVLIGGPIGGGGPLKGGRYLNLPTTPLMNLGLRIIDMFGGHIDKVADSTGVLTEL